MKKDATVQLTVGMLSPGAPALYCDGKLVTNTYHLTMSHDRSMYTSSVNVEVTFVQSGKNHAFR
jgi:hypothetical protein